jgi:hypothetical protein
MRRPCLPAKASIKARQHSGADTRVEYHTRLARHKEGGEGIQKAKPWKSVSRSPHHRCCCFKEAASRRCSRGGHQHEKAHEAGHNEAHIWKLEYQSYDVRVVVVKSVLYVESIGHRGSTPAPGEKQAALIER